MSKKRRESAARVHESRQKQRQTAITVAVVVCLVLAVIIILYRAANPKTANVLQVPPGGDGSLVVSTGSIGSKLTYIQYGGDQSILAWRNGNGEILTAFNTCEDCFSTGNAQYTQNGSNLVCGNCGNSYALTTLGVEMWGGCQPVSIPVSFRADSGGNIVFPAELLDYAGEMFASWRGGNYGVTLDDYTA